MLRLWRINRTCWEMLKDRGYNVPAARLELTLEDFKKEHGVGDAVRDNMTIVVAKTNDPQDQARARLLPRIAVIGATSLRQQGIACGCLVMQAMRAGRRALALPRLHVRYVRRRRALRIALCNAKPGRFQEQPRARASLVREQSRRDCAAHSAAAACSCSSSLWSRKSWARASCRSTSSA